MSRAVRTATQHAAEQKLLGPDPAAIGEALDTLAQLGGDPAALAITGRLRRGLPPALIEHAIDALVLVGKPSAGPVLLELALHRRAAIRQKAVAALGALKIKNAQPGLLAALDDPSPEVRVAAVLALAPIGNSHALPALLTAAERGVDHAFETIGMIAGPKDLEPILERGRHGDLTLIKPALQAMLERPSFPMQTKLTIVSEIGKIGSSTARMYLVEWLDAWKSRGDPQMRAALFDAIKRLDQAAKLLAGPAAQPAPATQPAPAIKPAPASKPAVKPASSTKPAPAAKPAAKTTAAAKPPPAASRGTATSVKGGHP